MRAVKTIITNLSNLIQILRSIELNIVDMSSYRSLLFDSLLSLALESIYRDLYSEPKEIDNESVLEAYIEIIKPLLGNDDIDVEKLKDSLNIDEIVKQLNIAKEELVYIVATEGVLSNTTFHTHVMRNNIIKIIMYDISPMERMKI